MPFFNPNNPAPFDPAAFDYTAAQGKLQQQQELAKALAQTQMPQGQMVSGHYVAPGLLSQALAAFSKYKGLTKLNEIPDQQAQLNDQGLQAMQYQLNNAPKPTDMMVPTDKAVPMGPPAPESYYNPSNVQRESVAMPDVQARPLGAPVPAAGPLAGAIGAQSQPQAPVSGANIPEADTGGYGVSMDTQKVTSQPSTADQMAYFAKLARTGPMGSAIASQAINNMFGAKGEFAVVKGEDGQFLMFNNKTGQYKSIGDPSGAVKRDKAPELVKQTYTGVRTPEELAQVNQSLIASGVHPSLLTTDVNVARGIGGQNDAMTKEREATVGYDQSKATVQQSIARLDSVLYPAAGQPKINDGTGMLGGLAASLPMATDSAAIRSRANDAASGIVLSTLQAMKSAGVGTGAFNSDAEGKRLENFAGSIDWTRMSTQEVTNKLVQLKSMSQDMLQRLDQARATTVPSATVAKTALPSSAAPQTPARGQRVSASQYGF